MYGALCFRQIRYFCVWLQLFFAGLWFRIDLVCVFVIELQPFVLINQTANMYSMNCVIRFIVVFCTEVYIIMLATSNMKFISGMINFIV